MTVISVIPNNNLLPDSNLLRRLAILHPTKFWIFRLMTRIMLCLVKARQQQTFRNNCFCCKISNAHSTETRILFSSQSVEKKRQEAHKGPIVTSKYTKMHCSTYATFCLSNFMWRGHSGVLSKYRNTGKKKFRKYRHVLMRRWRICCWEGTKPGKKETEVSWSLTTSR